MHQVQRAPINVITAALSVLVVSAPALAQDACQAARLAPADLNFFDSFGYAVAISGDTALVGAIWDDDNGLDSGSVYLFRFDGTTWIPQQKFLAFDGEANDNFGLAVAIDGNNALVGTAQHPASGAGTGAVYVFSYDGSAWRPTQELLALDGAFGDGFGIAVSLSGNVAVIGAAGDDDNGNNSGSSYLFRLDANGEWVEEQKLLASDGAATDGFGWAVAITGHTVVIGTPGHDPKCAPGAGAAYVFRFDPKMSRWTEEQKLLASDCAPGDALGESVGASEGVAILGTRFGNSGTGAAFVFRYDAPSSAWIEEQKLVASDGQGGDLFGRSVAIDGDTALVGASHDDDGGPSVGTAFVFRREGGRWVEKDKLLPGPEAVTPFFFGFSVGLSGDTGIVGAYGENGQRGAAYVFSGLSGADCNGNGLSDACEILDGETKDADGNGIPDECECPWDLDGSGQVSTADLLSLLGQWGSDPGGPPDFNGDGNVGTADLLELLGNWGPCPK